MGKQLKKENNNQIPFREVRAIWEKSKFFDEELTRKLMLNAAEIDADCLKISEIMRREVFESLKQQDWDGLLTALIDYDIRAEHLIDHLTDIRKEIPKALGKVERELPEN